MITLYNTLKESLLGGFDEIEAAADPKEEIRRFVKDNYAIYGHIKISDKPNENGKYVVDCSFSIHVKNQKHITSLTNRLFEWGIVKGDFDCSYCDSLTSLEGSPEEVGGNFLCAWCSSLISLEGAPEIVGGTFGCSDCESLTSLEGAPKDVGENFHCYGCQSLTSLKGAPKEVEGSFHCYRCQSLTSFKGSPKYVGSDFVCFGCQSLTSLNGAPKEVGRNFQCYNCGKKFTKEDVEKVCNVKHEINL